MIRPLLFLSTMVLLVGLFVYNFQQAQISKSIVQTIHEINHSLYIQNHHRVSIEQAYGSLLLNPESRSSTLVELKQTLTSSQKELLNHLRTPQIGQENFVDYSMILQKNIHLQDAYSTLPNTTSEEITPNEILAKFETWKATLSKSLHSLQNFNVELSETLTGKLTSERFSTLIINIFGVGILISTWFLMSFSKLNKQLNDNAKLNDMLNKKTADYRESQRLLASILEDVTEEKQRAINLAQANQHLAVLVENSRDGFIQLDSQGVIRHFNAAADSILSITKRNKSAAFFPNIFDGRYQKLIKKALLKISENETREVVNILYTKTENHISYFYDVHLTKLYSNDSPTEGIAITLKDVSHQHKQQEKLASLFDQAPNALLLANAEGSILLANNQAEILFGYEKGGLDGLAIEMLVPAAYRDQHPALRDSYFNSPTPRAMGAGRDLRGVRNDGSDVPLEIGLNPINVDDQICVLASIVDITERIFAKTQLEDMNKLLSQKNQEMERFVYTVSHDLRSPLVTIGGFSKSLYKELNDTLTDKHKHKMERILANVTLMETLLQDLLQLSRLTRQDIEKRQLDLSSIVENVTNAMANDIKETATDVQIQQPIFPIYANEQLLYQSLQNIFSNAIKYRAKDRSSLIILSMERDAEFTKLHITDNGIGIEPKYHKKIFELFERLNVGEGTGVGLAIVKSIAEKHGGRISIESELDIGSTFTIEFPNFSIQEEKFHDEQKY